MNKTYDIVGFLNHTARPGKKNRAVFEKYWAPATVVLSGVPTKADLLELVSLLLIESIRIPMTFGYASCHPDDQFVRKLGVEAANKKAVMIDFKLKSLLMSKDRTLAIFSSADWIVSVEYKEGSKGPKLSDCHKHRHGV